MIEQNEKRPCYVSHPPLVLKTKSKEMKIYGGSCIDPAIKDANIYVSLDEGVNAFDWEFPWNENKLNQKNIRFKIEDFSLPKSFNDFQKMIGYIKTQLLETNNKIHVGCYSGHGRTGLVLAALTHELMAKENKNFNAIDYVRESYCQHAVETIPQILYLKHFFGLKEPTREKDELVEFNNFFKDITGNSIKELLSQKIDKDTLSSYFLDIDKELYYVKEAEKRTNKGIGLKF